MRINRARLLNFAVICGHLRSRDTMGSRESIPRPGFSFTSGREGMTHLVPSFRYRKGIFLLLTITSLIPRTLLCGVCVMRHLRYDEGPRRCKTLGQTTGKIPATWPKSLSEGNRAGLFVQMRNHLRLRSHLILNLNGSAIP